MNWRRYAEDPSLAGFVPVEANGTRMLVRKGYEAQAHRLGLQGAPQMGGETVRGGRVAHALVPLAGDERAVVREYRRGGVLRYLNRKHYFLGHRSLEELWVTEVARGRGVRTPVPLAALERRVTLGYTASFVTLWIPESQDAAIWLEGTPEQRTVLGLRAAGEQIRKMHEAGVAHPDLNLRNLLVAEGGGDRMPVVYLLDFDRAWVYPGSVPAGRRARELLRLARSAQKLNAPVRRRGWAALREGYGEGWPLRSDLG